MNTGLFLFVAVVTVAKGDVTSINLTAGDCLCVNKDDAFIQSAACGHVIGSAVLGQCFRYSGVKSVCSTGQLQEFFQTDWNNEDGWLSGLYLDLVSDSKCEGFTAAGEYSCEVRAAGKRIHETRSHTPYDCVDRSCRNTCKGGQCVAYVTCSCKRNGKWAPNTSCWRPGQRVKAANGKCNRNIAPNTAIATFNSQGRYFAGHAAVFIKCLDDNTVQVYDQGCCKSISYSKYGSAHRYFSAFATITSPGCSDRASWICRVEDAGPSCCPVSVPGCKKASNWWEAMKYGGNEEEILL